MWFLRLAQPWRKKFTAQFLFCAKIKTTYPYVLPTIESLDLRAKPRCQWLDQVLSPKWWVFDLLHRTCSCSTGLSDEKSFYCGSLWYRLVLIHKKKKFGNWKFFHVGIDQKLIFFQLQKNQCSPLSPQFLMKSSKNMDKNGPEFEETPFHFFDFGQKFEF